MKVKVSWVAQTVKNLPVMQDTCVRCWEDPLGKGMATTHSNILAWRIPGYEKICGLQSKGLQRVGHDRVTNTFIFAFLFSSLGKLSPLTN